MKRWYSFLLIFLVGVAPVLARPQPVQAITTIVVGAGCSIYQAVQSANQNQAIGGCSAGSPGMDTISIPAGPPILIAGGPDEEQSAQGDLDIHESVRIEGAGMNATILNSDGNDRVIHIHPGDGHTVVYLSNLTIQGGGKTTVVESGGGIRNEAATLYMTGVRLASNASSKTGGGVAAVFRVIPAGSGNYVFPTTIIDSSIIERNSSRYGGGLYSDGAVDILRSAVLDNVVDASGSGGGLDNNDFSGFGMNINTVTIAGNKGPGAALSNSGMLVMLNTTVFENEGPAGLLIHQNSYTKISGSIIAGTKNGPNCWYDGGQDPLASGGYNLENTDTCGFGATDLIGVDPKLGGRNNAGVTPYYPFNGGSPAIDHGSQSLTCMGSMYDQRNVHRPMNGRCDIGSYEVDGPYTQPFFLWLPSVGR